MTLTGPCVARLDFPQRFADQAYAREGSAARGFRTASPRVPSPHSRPACGHAEAVSACDARAAPAKNKLGSQHNAVRRLSIYHML